ncbi:N-acetylglucosamine kinase [Phytomonospora endophytica]|uniref:N-acetylglucosamine kinase-like BadF-type ATPase n=1 Tax=Phytomonospora endophytica TaxID=714109 RepID=A0A841FKY1_9ACTN|nr:BadF/BadG/BcrA/BcrD ATPase family protein [Phytomonospora endophytica]MBB6033847.1 N-acetylglucosamine kinase-like BadF-type ATPase [Phytomonospora endophytica]GIG64634.1 N-acetylglucosamine kinase [Phytomonospora endophytica]
MHKDLVLGFDIGGTSTRALLATLDGERVGAAQGPGGNPTSHGLPASLKAIGEAAAAAIGDHDPARIRALHLGLAGGQPYEDPANRAQLSQVWTGLGIDAPVAIDTDLTVAFAAATPAPTGTVAIGGTGAIAAAIEDRHLTGRADGYGWLLGDEGSGYWLGRQAARVALKVLDGHLPTGPLAEAVITAAWPGPTRPATRELIDVIAHRPPLQLAAYARLVTTAADNGDPQATALLDEAATLLTTTIASVRHTGADTPIVLGGSLLTETTRVGIGVRTQLTARFPTAPLHTARDGAAGAAWLAAYPYLPDAVAAHGVFTAGG